MERNRICSSHLEQSFIFFLGEGGGESCVDSLCGRECKHALTSLADQFHSHDGAFCWTQCLSQSFI